MNRNTGASRRAVVRGLVGTVGAAALAPIAAMAQQPTAATGAPLIRRSAIHRDSGGITRRPTSIPIRT